MKETKLSIREESDGFRILSTDDTEDWDFDGPFATEKEAQIRLAEHEIEAPDYD